MRAVLEALRRPDEPTDEEFVNAVIQTHERIRSRLRTLAGDRISRDAGEASAEAKIIRAYNLSHGIGTGRIKEIPRVEPRWQAV